MKKRISSILICLCLTLALLPKSALADGVTDYDIWVGGVQVTSANASSITGPGITGTVSYDAVSNTLTLDDASVTGVYTDGNNTYGIYTGNIELNVELVGVNTVIGKDSSGSSYKVYGSGSSYGVYGSGSVAITGSGGLNTVGGTASYSYGLYGASDITISDSVNVTATGGKAANSSCGVGGSGNITISDSAVVTAIGGAATEASGTSYGVFGNTIDVNSESGSGLLIAKSGSAATSSAANTAPTCGTSSAALTGVTEDAIGKFAVWGVSDTYPTANIFTSTVDLSTWNIDSTHWDDTTGGYKTETVDGVNTLTLKNVIINAPDNISGNAYGIQLPESVAVNIVLEGVNVVSAGAASSGNSCGVGNSSNVNISSTNGDSLYTVAGTASGYSCGVYGGSVILSGIVTAIGGAAGSDSCGVYGGSVTLSGIVTAIGGAAGSDSCGVYGGSVTVSGTVTATGGSAGGTQNNSGGVYSTNGSISITGGTLTATGGTSGGDSGGVYSANSSISVTGGTLTATGGSARINSGGVYSYPGSMSVTGSANVTITGGNGWASYGAYCCNGISVTGNAKVTATGSTAMGESIGMSGGDGAAITLSGTVTVTATGGNGSSYSCGMLVLGATISITGGTITASGSSQAMRPAPNLTGCTNHGVLTSTSVNGTNPAANYDANSIATYKYLKIGVLYALTVNLNEGSGTTADSNYVAGTAISINAGAKSGYAFSGWTATGGGSFADASDAATTYTMPAGAAAITANWTAVYALTVALNGGSGATVSGDHAAGKVVSIDAGTKSGYTFSGWTAKGGGTFANASSAATTYTMPAGAATITANWTVVSSSGGGTSTPVITVPVSSNAGTVEVSASVSGTTTRVSGTDAQLQKIASGTKAAGTIELDVSDLKVDTIVVPAKLISAADGAALEVTLPTGTVTLNKDALASVADKGDVKLSVATVDNSKLTDTQRAALGNQAGTATVVDVNLYAGGSQVSTFGDGTLQVSIPYTLKSGENADSVTVWFVKDDGTIEPKSGTYADGKVTFTTQHLSRYLIVDFPFTDVAESAWCYGGVAYTYNSGLLAGTSDTTFSPNMAMTRQMVWMVLARMDGKAPASMDEAKSWAVENKISDGSHPTSAITREQLAAILYRYAQDKGYDVSMGEETNILSYDDALTISEYAIPAIQWTCGAGLMQGSGNKLMPFGTATRAQVAAILQRFCENPRQN